MATTAQPPYGGTILQNGSSGPDVALVQRWLNGLRVRWPGLPQLTTDGQYGSTTAEAVTLYQMVNGLKADGKVGPATWQDLANEYAALHGEGEIYPGISLRQGHTGATVKSAQQQLQATVPTLAADGRFGPRTQSAVIAYQAAKGLTSDGIIGPSTWTSLYSPTTA